MISTSLIFFFQAEDGIRDLTVTGVQTCALPIWDLRPDSKMTNANVADVVKMANDRVMSVKYKGGEKKILVTPKTVVVTYTPSNRSELKPGAPVFAVTQRQPDGTLTAARVNVGLHGQVPPM